MNANIGVVGGDPGFCRKRGEGTFFNVNCLQRFSIFRFEILQDASYTPANFILYKLHRLAGYIQALGPRLEQSLVGTAGTIVVDYRVSQQSVEPRNRTFIAAKLRYRLDSAQKGSLQNVFCSRSRVDALLKKSKELIATREKSFQYFPVALEQIPRLLHTVSVAWRSERTTQARPGEIVHEKTNCKVSRFHPSALGERDRVRTDENG